MKYLDTKENSIEDSVTRVLMGEKLVGGQKKLDKDKDGDIDGKDFAMLRKAAAKKKKEMKAEDMFDENKKLKQNATLDFELYSTMPKSKAANMAMNKEIKRAQMMKDYKTARAYMDKVQKKYSELGAQDSEPDETIDMVLGIVFGKKNTSRGTPISPSANKKFFEKLDDEDESTVKKVVAKLKKASQAHADQAKTLTKDLQDEIEEDMAPDEIERDAKKAMSQFNSDMAKIYPSSKYFARATTAPMGGGIAFEFAVIPTSQAKGVDLRNAPAHSKFMMHLTDGFGKKVPLSKVSIQQIMGRLPTKFRKITARTPTDAVSKMVDFFKKNKSDFESLVKEEVELDEDMAALQRKLDKLYGPKKSKDIEKMMKDRKYKGNTSAFDAAVKKKYPNEYKTAVVQDIIRKHAETNEGFASDAQRRAAFASGYKAKGKKDKKESYEIGQDYAKHTLEVTPGQDKKDVDEMLGIANKKNMTMREALAKVWGINEGKSPFQKKEEMKKDKTMTGKKPTEVKVDPEIKK